MKDGAEEKIPRKRVGWKGYERLLDILKLLEGKCNKKEESKRYIKEWRAWLAGGSKNCQSSHIDPRWSYLKGRG